MQDKQIAEWKGEEKLKKKQRQEFNARNTEIRKAEFAAAARRRGAERQREVDLDQAQIKRIKRAIKADERRKHKARCLLQ